MANPRTDEWAEAEIEVLVKGHADGVSASQISKQLGTRTRNAVIGKMNRMGLVSKIDTRVSLRRRE
jgi:GcrA cell cycle regulator